MVLVCVSALVFSLAGIFTNGVASDAWTIIFWRALSAAILTIAYLYWRGDLLFELRSFGKPGVAIVLMSAAGSAAFIPAFKHSSVADVALIWATAPFVAASISWFCIREAPSRLTLQASIFSLLGVLIIVAGSLGTGKFVGIALAAFMTLMMSGIMVTYRKWPETTAALPAALGCIVLLPVAVVFGQPLSAAAIELPPLLLFGGVFAIASVTLSEGARRLPSAETALLSALETPLAPMLAFLILREVPTPELLVGGTIVFLAVIYSQVHE